MLENKFTKIGKQNPTVKATLVLPGLLYGRGEDELYYIFEQCLKSESLQIYFEGDNYLPLIHVRDFINLLNLILFQSEEWKPFHILVDNSRITQSQLLEFVAGYFNLPTPERKFGFEVFFEKDFLARTINLQFHPTVTSQQLEMKIESINEIH